MAKSSKGGAFERQFSRWLSLWWSEGLRNDLFWRSGGSGSVSTVTGQKAMAGDIVAVDTEGQELTDLITWELKCGYPNARFSDLLDGLGDVHQLATFVGQAHEAHVRAGSVAWALVHRRPRKHALIWFPGALTAAMSHRPDRVTVRCGGVGVVGYRLEDWFEHNEPLKLAGLLRLAK